MTKSSAAFLKCNLLTPIQIYAHELSCLYTLLNTINTMLYLGENMFIKNMKIFINKKLDTYIRYKATGKNRASLLWLDCSACESLF